MRIDGYRRPPKYGGNYAEKQLERYLNDKDVDWTRRGYPDYAIVENDEIIGFVEVKPSSGSGARKKKSQERFRRFCQRYNIPFRYWTPKGISEDGSQLNDVQYIEEPTVNIPTFQECFKGTNNLNA